jgi:rod shape-determining protein MreD
VKATSVLVTVLISVIVQMTLARYTVGGRWWFDLVLVGVVYASLNWGPVAGMVAGTAGGLIQDALSDDIVGTGGLAKTVIGFATGAVGAQFVVARPAARTLMVAAASVLHRLIIIGLQALIAYGQHWPGVPWPAILGETALNSICALVLFQATESLPGALARGRHGRRSGLSKRQW